MKSIKKRLPLIFVTLFSLSLLATWFHYHNNLSDNPNCVICKFAKDLSSGENVAHSALIPPEPAIAIVVTQSHVCSYAATTFSEKARAPPAWFK